MMSNILTLFAETLSATLCPHVSDGPSGQGAAAVGALTRPHNIIRPPTADPTTLHNP
jgi:hypothetical protein